VQTAIDCPIPASTKWEIYVRDRLTSPTLSRSLVASWARLQLLQLAHQLVRQFQATAKYKALAELWEAQQAVKQEMRGTWPARLLRYSIPTPTTPRAITYLIQRRAEALSASSKGKLGSQLAAQKAKTQSQTLSSASQVERDTRDADSAAEARQWN
jgi:hypothetical protein